jgi:hypothetical protein
MVRDVTDTTWRHRPPARPATLARPTRRTAPTGPHGNSRRTDQPSPAVLPTQPHPARVTPGKHRLRPTAGGPALRARASRRSERRRGTGGGP